MATITTLGFTIFSTYDGRGTNQARRDINQLTNDAERNNVALRASASGMSLLAAAAVTVAPAMGPITQAAIAAGGAVTAMAASSGAALGAYGIAMRGAITDTLKMAKAHKDLTPVQQTFVNSVHQMKSAMDGVSTGTMNLTLKTATVITQGLTATIKGMTPVIQAVHPVIMKVAEGFRSWAQGDGLKRFVDIVIQQGIPSLEHLLNAGRNVLSVLGTGFRAFAPLGTEVAAALERGSVALKGWADGGGFNRFIDKVQANAPQIKEFFKALWDAIKNITISMGAMAPLSLAITTQFLKLVAATPPAVIQAIAQAYVAWKVAMVGLMVIQTLVGVVNGFRTALVVLQGALGAARIAAVAFDLSLAPFLITAGLVIAVIAALGVAVYLMVTRWKEFSTYMSSSFMNAVNAVWNALKAFGSWISGVFSAAWNGVKAAWSAAWNWLKSTGTTIWNGIKTAWQAVGNAFTSIWQSTSNTLKSAWSSAWNAIKAAGVAVWNAIKAAWQAVLQFVVSFANSQLNVLKSAWSAAWNAIKTVAQTIWNALKAAWQAFLNGVKSAYDAWSNAYKAAWNALWNAVKTAAQAVWNAMKSAWQAFLNGVKSVYDAFSNTLKSAWQGMWNAIKSVAESVWNAIKSGFSSFATGVENTLSGLVDKAKSIWNKIVDVFKTPVNAVIGIWDTVAGAIGLPKISKLAAGGEVGGEGHSTQDNILALLSPGEFVMPASAVRKYGVDTMEDMRRHRYAAGGLVAGGIPIPDPIKNVVGSVVGGVKNAIGNIWDKLKGVAATAVYDMAKPVLDTVVRSVPNPIPGVQPPAGSVPHAAIQKIEESILAKLKEAQQAAKAAAAAIGGTIPTGAHKALIDAALAKAGIPKSQWPMWEAGLNTLIMRESSWNPNAINLWDSNAKAGHPTQGLMQLLPSNFARYGLGGSITDPVSNIVAGIRYINAVYGGIGRVQQANANANPKGYWMGTGMGTSGWHMIGENGPEWVRFGASGGRVEDNARTRESFRRRGGDGEIHFHEKAFYLDLRGASKEAIQYAEGEMCDKLRMAVQAGVGKRGY